MDEMRTVDMDSKNLDFDAADIIYLVFFFTVVLSSGISLGVFLGNRLIVLLWLYPQLTYLLIFLSVIPILMVLYQIISDEIFHLSVPPRKDICRRVPINPSPPKLYPLLPPCSKTKTLFIDLDRTLIFTPNTPPRPGRYNSSELLVLRLGDQTFYTVKRPYVTDLLRHAVAYNYEVVIFTASKRDYAEAIVGWLDPNSNFISHVLSREACSIDANKQFFKDLDATGRPVERSVVIDDDPGVYWKHDKRVIPVKPFKGDKKDDQLKRLLTFFKHQHYLFDDVDLRFAINPYVHYIYWKENGTQL